MTTIFLDESGFTGQDLLNQEQPIFTIATLGYPEAVCQEFKTVFFKNVRASELKYSSLKKYGKQQYMVLSFLRELVNQVDLVKISIVNKRYALVAKLVDLVIEPAANEDGLDLYKDGAASAFADCLYYVLPALGGQSFFEDLLRRFQEMLYSLSPESYSRFFQLLFSKGYSQEVDQLLWALRAPYLNIGYDLLEKIKEASNLSGSGPLDIGLTCTLGLMMKWRQQLSDRIILVHDRSSQMAKELHVWKALVDPHLPNATFGKGERAWTFPNVIEETHLEDSKVKSGLQLADIVAGATTQWAKWLINGQRSEDTYGSSLNAVIRPLLTDVEVIWPSRNSISETAQTDFDVSSMMDYFSEIFRNLDEKRTS